MTGADSSKVMSLGAVILAVSVVAGCGAVASSSSAGLDSGADLVNLEIRHGGVDVSFPLEDAGPMFEHSSDRRFTSFGSLLAETVEYDFPSGNVYTLRFLYIYGNTGGMSFVSCSGEAEVGGRTYEISASAEA